MPGFVLCGVLGAVCVGLMSVQTLAQITGSDLTTTAVNHVTGLKVKADGDPIGTIKAWPATHNPDTSEWLECNGGTFSKTTYPDLFAVLGTTTLPDYTGRFLRGGKAADAGKKFEDTIKTHEIIVENHKHSINAVFSTKEKAITSVSSSSSSLNLSSGSYAISSFLTADDIYSSGSNGFSNGYGCYISKSGNIQYCYNRESWSNNTHQTYGAPIFMIIDGIAIPAGGTICRSAFLTADDIYSSGSNGFSNGYGCYISKSGNIQYCYNRESWSYHDDDHQTYGAPILTIFKNCKSSNSTITTQDVINNILVDSNVLSGSLVGETQWSGELTGTYNGASETAPKHVIVRFFIKAL